MERIAAQAPTEEHEVRRRLRDFSSPTAIVNTRVLVTRGRAAGPQPAPVRLQGTMEFTHGSAAFFKFPYPFNNMAGLVRFDNDKIDFNPDHADQQCDSRIGWPKPGVEFGDRIRIVDLRGRQREFGQPRQHLALVSPCNRGGAQRHTANAQRFVALLPAQPIARTIHNGFVDADKPFRVFQKLHRVNRERSIGLGMDPIREAAAFFLISQQAFVSAFEIVAGAPL